jgi:chromatin remodeling complex protein RSC6
MKASSVPVPENVSTEVNIETLMAKLLSEQVEIAELHKQHTRKIKECMKLYKRERKQYSKKSKKVKDPNAPKKLNAFTTPIKISDKLCTFLKKPKGSLMARTEVTKAISKYIKSNKLSVPENKKQFRPDSYLGNILTPLQERDLETGYTYFNLQRYISSEFIKSNMSSSNAVNTSM